MSLPQSLYYIENYSIVVDHILLENVLCVYLGILLRISLKYVKNSFQIDRKDSFIKLPWKVKNQASTFNRYVLNISSFLAMRCKTVGLWR